MGRGLSNQLAAHAAQRYSSQLAELAQMGFSDDAALSVSLLDKYNGRLLRVVNALSDAREAQPPPPRPAPFAPRAAASQNQQARFAAAFKRHVAAGLPPNEAARRAAACLPSVMWAREKAKKGEDSRTQRSSGPGGRPLPPLVAEREEGRVARGHVQVLDELALDDLDEAFAVHLLCGEGGRVAAQAHRIQ